MMIGKLLQTALISLTSGACLTQAPTFNNVKQANNETGTTYNVDLNNVAWLQTNTVQNSYTFLTDSDGDYGLNYPNSYKTTTLNRYAVNEIQIPYNLGWIRIAKYEKIETPPKQFTVLTDEDRVNMYANARITYYIWINSYYPMSSVNYSIDIENTDAWELNGQSFENEADCYFDLEINVKAWNTNNDIKSRIENNNLSEYYFSIPITNANLPNLTSNPNQAYQEGSCYGDITGADDPPYTIENNISGTTTIPNVYDSCMMMITEEYSFNIDLPNIYDNEVLTFSGNNYENIVGIKENTANLSINIGQTGTSESNSESGSTINYEVVDIAGLMFNIIAMPFSFISQAFNLTIFPNTPYEINFGNIFLTIMTTLILLFVIKLVMKGR